MLLRFRRLVPAYGRVLFSLPPGSRIRQALLWRGYRLGYEAFNRHDFETLVLPVAREAELHPPRELVEMGIAEPSYHGPGEYLGFLNAWASAWTRLRISPTELIGLGDRLLMLGRTEGRGQGSGIPVSTPYASLYRFKDGQLIQHHGSSATPRPAKRPNSGSRRCRRTTSRSCGRLMRPSASATSTLWPL